MFKNKGIKIAIATLTSCIALSTTVLASNFTDTESHWGKQNIDYLNSKKIITGYPDKTFKPDNNISREEVSKILSSYIGEKEVENDKLNDIEGRWSTKFIKHLVNEGIITGYPNDTFRPSNNVTRAEFANMTYKYLEKENKLTEGELSNLSDVGNHWAKESIEAVAKAGVIKGYPDGTFKPENSITRAEVSSVVSLMDGFKPVEEVEEKPEEDEEIVAPPKEESKIQINDMKEESYQSGSNYDLKVYDPKDVLNGDGLLGKPDFYTNFYKGVIKMKLPSHYNFELKDLKSAGKTYSLLHCGELIKDGYGKVGGGSLLNENGEEIAYFIKTSETTFSFGLKEERLIEKAEYIAFQKYAKDYMKDVKVNDNVLVIFENPFKK